MTRLRITAGPFVFDGVLEEEAAPKTCAAFKAHIPYENHTSYPAPGQFILYPGGISETEILLAYGGVAFASKMGQLAGNHFMTIISGQENLMKLGNKVLWEGAQPLKVEFA